MTGLYIFYKGTEYCSLCLKSFPLCCLMFLRIFLPLRQSWPSNLVREQTIVLFVSDRRTSLLVLVCHDWNYMSLLSTENTIPLSSLRKLSFLFDSWWLLLFPHLRSELWSLEFSSSDQYEVLQTHSLVKNLSAHHFEQFMGHRKPQQSEAEQSPEILTCTIVPRSHLKAHRLLIIELDQSNVEILDIVILQTYTEQVWELYRFISSGCTEMFVDHVSNLSSSWGSVVFFEHAALRHLLFCGSEHACR